MPENQSKTFEIVIRFRGNEILPITSEHLRLLANHLMEEKNKEQFGVIKHDLQKMSDAYEQK